MGSPGLTIVGGDVAGFSIVTPVMKSARFDEVLAACVISPVNSTAAKRSITTVSDAADNRLFERVFLRVAADFECFKLFKITSPKASDLSNAK